jgi:hypothetical protein
MDQDFGFLGVGAIGRIIFHDADGSGTAATSGEGIPNVTVNTIWDGPDGTFDTADDHTYTRTTDDTGVYEAGNLPAGSFRVLVDTATVPSGSSNTVDPDGGEDSSSSLDLSVAETNLEQNFGYQLPVAPVTPPPATPVQGTLPLTGSDMAGRTALVGLMMLVSGLALAVAARRNGVLQSVLGRLARTA